LKAVCLKISYVHKENQSNHPSEEIKMKIDVVTSSKKRAKIIRCGKIDKLKIFGEFF